MEKKANIGNTESAKALSSGETLGQTIRRSFAVPQVVLFVIVLVLLAVGGMINPRFLGVDNMKIVTRDIAILAIAAIGVGFPILTGGIDLSVGSVVGLGGVIVAYCMMNLLLPVWLSILLTLILAVLLGSFHGLFVTKLKMHGFLITLVTLGLARGFILVLTNAFPITGLPREFNTIGQGYVADLIPVPLVICSVIAVFAYYLLRFTYIGRQIYATGSNVDAARLSGVNVDARIILCYIFSVVCATIVGMIQAARLSIGHPAAGEGYELLAIAACILGGVSLMGGQGSIFGILVGAALIGTVQNAMVMLNINPYWHKIVISLVLLVAITLDYARRRRESIDR
ncbi:MAG: ABC transporter permease [Anaerolineales bacterium]|nr:ABC transporter permease [Anaerolineales bacterium]